MKRYGCLLLAALLLALSGCAGDDSAGDSSGYVEFEAQTWRVACSGGEDAPDAKAAARFGELVYRATNGAVRVECYPADALTEGGAEEGLRSLMDGGTELALYPGALCAGLDPRFQVTALPFLFASAEAADAAMDGDGGAAMGEILREYGLQCVGIGTDGFRPLTNSVRPVACVADLKGLRLWTGEAPLLGGACALWGAEVVDAPWAGVYTALQTGTYDGQAAALRAADAASIQQVQSYATDWTASCDWLYFCMNAALYDSLAPTLQTIVDECGREAAVYQRQLSREQEAAVLASWRRAGVAVTELTDEAAAEFRAAAQPCYDAVSQSLTPELTAVFTEG